MLYPIELLRHWSQQRTLYGGDGEHVNQHVRICHVSIGHYARRPFPLRVSDDAFGA